MYGRHPMDRGRAPTPDMTLAVNSQFRKYISTCTQRATVGGHALVGPSYLQQVLEGPVLWGSVRFWDEPGFNLKHQAQPGLAV